MNTFIHVYFLILFVLFLLHSRFFHPSSPRPLTLISNPPSYFLYPLHNTILYAPLLFDLLTRLFPPLFLIPSPPSLNIPLFVPQSFLLSPNPLLSPFPVIARGGSFGCSHDKAPDQCLVNGL